MEQPEDGPVPAGRVRIQARAGDGRPLDEVFDLGAGEVAFDSRVLLALHGARGLCKAMLDVRLDAHHLAVR